MKLQSKFLSFLLPAGLIAAGVILFLIQRSVHAVIMSDLERNVLAVTMAAAQDIAPNFAAGDENRLLSHLQTLQNREGALFAAAFDLQGKILSHTTIAKEGETADDPVVVAALHVAQPVVRAATAADGPALDVYVPVWSAPKPLAPDSFMFSGEANAGPRARLGLINIRVPLDQFLDTESRILRVIVMIFVAVGGLAAAVILLLVRGVLRPVNGLMAGIASLARGASNVHVPVVSTDELGDLARSFNSMSADLARTTVSKDYVEGILENMADLLVVVDTQGRIETINPAMLKALSYGAAEMLGRPLSGLFVDPPSALQRQEFAAFAADGGIHDLEVTLLTRTGRGVPALFSASILKDREGRLRGYIGVAKDMTERKRTEEALLAAKAAAEASNKELETFSYSVAHDLRAPLRAVDGFSQVVLDRYADKLDDEGKDYLRRVRGGSRRMGQLIDDLLNLSRITRAAMRLEKVDLAAHAREIIGELKRSQPERTVDFSVDGDLTVVGDPNLLRVVLVNLLGNAWKYTGRKPSARIEFGVTRYQGESVYFVRDDGAGFDMTFSNKLFKPFNRLHAASQFEGTGIGLATVQRIIGRHGGRVWGESAVEKGATFYFTLGEGAAYGQAKDTAGRG